MPGKGQPQRTAFFWRLLHQWVPLRVRCASLPHATSRKIASSIRHGEGAIIAIRSHLPIKHSCEHSLYQNACIVALISSTSVFIAVPPNCITDDSSAVLLKANNDWYLCASKSARDILCKRYSADHFEMWKTNVHFHGELAIVFLHKQRAIRV